MSDPSLIAISLPFGLAPLTVAPALLWGLGGVFVVLTLGAIAADLG